jgi:hypothetical protein
MVDGFKSLVDVGMLADDLGINRTYGSPEVEHLLHSVLVGVTHNQKFDPITCGKDQRFPDGTVGPDESLQTGVAIGQGQLFPDGNLGCAMVKAYEVNGLIHYEQWYV